MIPTRSFAPGRDFSAKHFAGYYLMRLVPYAGPRRAVAAALAKYIHVRHSAHDLAPPPPDLTPHLQTTLQTLAGRGCAFLDPIFTSEQLVDIRGYLADKPMVSGKQTFTADQAPPGVARASYSLATILNCPHVLDAINRPDILALATAYIGCRPTISGLAIHWSFPTADGCDVQRFHRDPDDWRFLKVFSYLSDVDEQSGPHEFVTTSHRTSGRLRSVPYQDDEVERRFGRDNVVKMVGPRGTTFCADTWGIHKGGVPIARPRLMLQTQYSVLPVAKFKYMPQKVAAPKTYDPYTNRLLVA